MHAFDGQTDVWTDSFLVTRPPCIQCSMVTTHGVRSDTDLNKMLPLDDI